MQDARKETIASSSMPSRRAGHEIDYKKVENDEAT